jgi:hypothetical protein
MVYRYYTGPVLTLLAGVALFVAATLPVVPGASASSASQSVYVGNAGSTVTSYSTSASGDSAPSASLSEGGNAGSLAFDSSGDLWVGSGPGAGAGSGVLSEYTPSELGSSGSAPPTVQITSSSVGVNTGGAFDSSGDLWLACQGCHSFSEFAASQLASSGTKAPALTIGTGTASPNGIAIDEHGDVWVSNFNEDTLSEYTPGELGSSGTPAPAVVISATGGSLSAPARLAFDGADDLWVANNGGNSVVEYTAAELASSGAPAPAVVLSSTASNSLDGPNALGFDGSGDLWVIDETSNTLVEFSPSQLASSGTPTPVDTITGSTTGIDNPWVLAIGAVPAPPTSKLGSSTSKLGSSTAVSSSRNPSTFGQTVTFTATVSATASGSATPTGTVTFLDDGTQLGVAALSRGTGTFTTTSLAVGSHTITASYGGDPNFNASTGSLNANPEVVTAPSHVPSSSSCTSNTQATASRAVPAALAASGQGYWEAGANGKVNNVGSARFYGDLSDVSLEAPIVGMAPTPDGKGYWLVAGDGGIFAFGDARYYGSTGGITLNKPIVGMAPTPDGKGYWLVGADGNMFFFGDAKNYGSTGDVHLTAPIVGMAPTPDGKGYWLVAGDGGTFAFADARYLGHSSSSVVAIAALPSSALLCSSLASQVAPHGKKATIAHLLKTGALRQPFTAPSPGRLVIDWYYLPDGAHLARTSAGAKPELIAAGKAMIAHPERLTMTIKLTPRGKILLQHEHRVALTAQGTFTSTGGQTVTAAEGFTLKR